ncbi:MAG: signal recognition particle-docking protein FtsY [Bacilli bacterium]|nr:signal recognition particle-docking protein FtsY [Bacilli bacterium]
MGLFNKIKNMFKSYDEEEKLVDGEQEELKEESAEESEEIEEELAEEKEIEEEPVDGLNPLAIDQEEPTLEVKEEKPEKKEKKLFKKKDKKEEEKKSVKIYEKGLTKSRQGFVSKLANLTNKYNKVTEEYFEELEEILIMADIGVNTVMDFMDRLKDRVKSENIEDPNELKEIIVDELFIIYVNDEVLSNKINYNENGPTVILFIGVNGVGKTTTIAKIANKLKDEGKKVLMVGADTFRAGAVEQLREWSERVGVGFFGKEGSDPASVVYDGITMAKEEDYDIVLIDTAGRLQNKVNLMKELEKMNKVIDNLIEGGASETLLVLDATTGQNGISQANAFKEITNITGIVLTKLDGTAKGGIVLAIKESVGIPVKYIGLGETKDDLQTFDIEKYIYGLFKDMM